MAVSALAAHRAARAVTTDSITNNFRERMFLWTTKGDISDRVAKWREYLAGDVHKGSGHQGLITCPHCCGFWFSLITVAVWEKVPVLRWVIMGWAAAGIQSTLASMQADLDNRILKVAPASKDAV